MKTTLSSLLLIAGISSILFLSSFYRSSDNPSPTQTEDRKERGAISMRSAFENAYYTRNDRVGHFYTEVKSGQATENISERSPMNLSVVIDRSGSMAGEKIRNARLAACFLVDQLNENDILSIVIYDGSVDVLQSAIHVSNRSAIKAKINQIIDRGGTNLMGGAAEGYAQVKRNYRSQYINRVLLLSDGLANEGITDPSQIRNIVRSKSMNEDITLSTFGVGRDYNEDLMTAMAENGNGNYYFIDNSEKISSIFEKELHGLSTVIARNTVLNIQIPDHVTIEKVYGNTYVQEGRTLSIRFNTLFSNETKGILIRYRVDPAYNTPVNFYSNLSYVDQERKQAINLQNRSDFTNNKELYIDNFNAWVGAQVTAYESNEILESAMREVDKGHYDEAKKLVKQNETYIQSKPAAVRNAPEVKSASVVNDSYTSKLEDVEVMPVEDVKFMQKDIKNSNYLLRNKK
jgi:Ca-activated chloride channel family protein